MSQTSYSLTMNPANVGQLADLVHNDVMSYLNGGTNNIPFGLAVKRISGQDSQCDLPGSSGDDIVGIALLSVKELSLQAPGASPVVTPSYVPGDAVSVLRHGRAWVLVEENVTPASPVYVRFASGTGTQLGSFRASADTATAVAVTKMRYLSTASAGGLALVEVMD